MGNPRDVLALLDEVPATVWSQPDAELPAPNHLLARTRDELETCGPDGRSFVEAMAVLGEAGSLAEATMLAGLDDPLQAVDSAVSAGLLTMASPHSSHGCVIL